MLYRSCCLLNTGLNQARSFLPYSIDRSERARVMCSNINASFVNSHGSEVSLFQVFSITRRSLRELQSLFGSVQVEIMLSQDTVDLSRVQKSGEWEFLLRFSNTATLPDHKWLSYRNQLIRFIPQLWSDTGTGIIRCIDTIEKFRSARQSMSSLVAELGLASDLWLMPSMMLTVLCCRLLQEHQLQSIGAIDPTIKAYLHVLLGETMRFNHASPSVVEPKFLREHRSIVASNMPLRKFVRNILESVAMGQTTHWSHQHLNILLMGISHLQVHSKYLTNFAKQRIHVPKCHCLSVTLSCSIFHTASQVAPERNGDPNEIGSTIVSCSAESNFNRCVHPHFCAHCGIFESENIKLKTCRTCKQMKLPARYLMCSMACQVLSWDYHKKFHRMPAVNLKKGRK